ncbi:MAG: hypothetical protein ABIH23_24335 [bacterium]
MWKTTIFLFLAITGTASGDGFLGVHEADSTISFTYLAADPTTGAPTEATEISYKILQDGVEVGSGAMYSAELGIATGAHSVTGCEQGMYTLLMAGIVAGVTHQQLAAFTLVNPGAGQESLHTQLTDLAESVEDVSREIRIVTRENSRSRLWFAQSIIDNATRKVPADLPSHLEVQISCDDTPDFATPEATFYRVFFYPDSVTSTRACREEKHGVPPSDGTFYALPNNSW